MPSQPMSARPWRARRLQRDRDPVAVLGEIVHPPMFSSEIRLLSGRREKHPVNVGAMGDRVGLANGRTFLAERDAGDQPAGDRVAHFLRGGPASANIGSVQADRPSARKMLGPSWMPAPSSRNSGACSSTRTGNPLRAGAGRRQTADPAARNQDRKVLAGHAACSRTVSGTGSGLLAEPSINSTVMKTMSWSPRFSRSCTLNSPAP